MADPAAPFTDALAFLGFGEAARAFRATLAEVAPAAPVTAWDIKLTGADAPAMRAAIAGAGVAEAPTPAALSEARWVFSAVTADQSLKALEPLLPALDAGVTIIDINSVSPGRKRATAAAVEGQGARYIDMAVMTPVHPRGHRAPVLVAGHGLETDTLARLEFDATEVGDAPGEATAIKMVRSTFIKGLEAIMVETLLAAERSGCTDLILKSLAAHYPGLGWPGIASHIFERTLSHGTRRAAEMHEVAVTLNELGLQGAIATASAEIEALQGAAGPPCNAGPDLAETLRRSLAARLRETAP
ncbi:MAG: DUF1932 domain-containing protein [Pseudomonadota bacterium]